MITKIRDKAKRFFFSILPGFLLWASFPPMGETMDCFFALAPVLWFARRKSARENAKTWFWNGLFFWVATLSWMPAIVKNGGPWPLVALGWGALSAYCALYFAAFGWLAASYWSWVRGGADGVRRGYGWRLAGLLVVEPVLWAGLELVRSRLFGGFAWNQLGVAPVNAGFGAPAALGGVYLASALVVLVNGTIASIAERMWKPEKSGVPSWARSVETILPFLVVWGVFAAGEKVVERSRVDDDWNRRPPVDDRNRRPPELRVALIQRNFPSVFERDRDEDPLAVYKNLLSTVAPLRPDLVVTPESALCEFGAVDSRQARRWGDWVMAQTGAAGVLAGGSREADGKTYNSAALYLADGGSSVYDKVHLVPFGEFIPGDKIFPALQKLAPVGSCTPGELKTLPFKDVKLGVAICFEDTDSAQMRRLAETGADALVFITNDSWFSRSDEAVQHAWQAVARAVETGLPVVRVGNSGVTGTIAPDGRTAWLAGADGRPLVDAAASMFDRVPLVSGGGRRAASGWRTPYVMLGDKPLLFAFLLLITAMGVVKYLHANQKRRKLSL